MPKSPDDLKWLDQWTEALAALDKANPWFGQTSEPDTEPARGPVRPQQLRDEQRIGKPFKLTK